MRIFEKIRELNESAQDIRGSQLNEAKAGSFVGKVITDDDGSKLKCVEYDEDRGYKLVDKDGTILWLEDADAELLFESTEPKDVEVDKKHATKIKEPLEESEEEQEQETEVAPPAEKEPKVDHDALDRVVKFANKIRSEVDSNKDFTFMYMEESKEISKYNLPLPGLALVCYDMRSRKATLKQNNIVKKFNASKTLKRYLDWVSTEIDGRRAWLSIYIDAKLAREAPKPIRALKEEYSDVVGYVLDEEQVIYPRKGFYVSLDENLFPIIDVDGNQITVDLDGKHIVLNEGVQVVIPESEVFIFDRGEVHDGYEVLFESDSSVYFERDGEIFECNIEEVLETAYAELDALEEALKLTNLSKVKEKYGDGLEIFINGTSYRYIPCDETLDELFTKLEKLVKYSPGKAVQYLKNNCILYAKNNEPISYKVDNVVKK